MQQQVISTTLPMLILGLGWTGQFLSSLLLSQNMNYAATTRDGRNHTISWSLNCSQVDVSALPFAETVLVTFPVMQPECMSDLMDKYQEKHAKTPQWVLLSSTRPFVGNPANRHTPLDKSKDTGRMGAEDVVIQRGGSVMHLAGLWGDQRYVVIIRGCLIKNNPHSN
jgi:hypothetical protein